MNEIHVVYRAGAEAVRQVVMRTLPEATVVGLSDPLNGTLGGQRRERRL